MKPAEILARTALYLTVLFCFTLHGVDRAFAADSPDALQSLDLGKTEDSKGDWVGSIGLGFSMNKGNSDTSLVSLGGDLEKVEGSDQWRFKANGQYGESDGTKDTQDAEGEAQYRNLFAPPWYASVEVTGEHDEFADLDYRFAGTPALGYYFFDTDQLRLSLEAGPSFIVEKQGGEKEQYPAATTVERLRWQFSKNSALTQSFRAFVSLEDGEDSVIKNSLGLDVKMITNVGIGLSFEHTYDNQPAEGADRNDIALITAFKVFL